ncbi:MAG: ADOP family duplicated permease [Bryobacteraceae bacterium]
MEWFRKLAARLAGNPGDDAAEEIRFHREERAAELEAAGRPPREAAAQAAREIGSAAAAIEESRDAWRLGWIEDLARDLRYGARALVRDKAFTVTAVASLALGIGLNTAMFSLAAEFLFSEPSVRDPARIAHIRVGGNSHASPEEVRYLRESGVYDGLAGYHHGEANWNAGDASLRLQTFLVTGDFFEVLGVPVAAGRGIVPGDRDAAVITHRFWRSRLGGDPAALSRILTIDGRAHTIAGILPEGHRCLTGFGFEPDLYLPLTNETMRIELYGRLPEGVSHAAAREQTRAVAARLDRALPGGYKRAADIRVNGLTSIQRIKSNSIGTVAVFFAMLMAAVDLVLLIACINVASLLLARASARRQELAVRLSLGAGRSRLVRQLLAESLLLAAIATAAGISLNLVLTRMLNQLRLPLPAPVYVRVEPDWRLLVYAAAVAVACAIVAGLLPALKAARWAGAIHGSRETGSGARLRSAMVGGQVAVTFVVLAVAVLFLRNLARSSSMSPGFDVDRLVYANMRVVPERYATDARLTQTHAEALAAVRAIPGVERAAAAAVVPFQDQETRGGTFSVAGDPKKHRVQRVHNYVTPDYFRAAGIPILAGREFEPGDEHAGARAIIVNRAFAERVWGTVAVVGRVLDFGGDSRMTVAGVCANSKFMTIGEDDKAASYEPYVVRDGDRRFRIELLIRTAAPESIVNDVRGVLSALDRSAAVEVRPMSRAMGIAMLPSQIGAGLMGAIGLMGLVLASVGLYGVLAYGVARRVREIGVRMALGAQRRDVVGLVVQDTAWIAGAGVTMGAAVAVFVTKPLAMFLIAGLKPSDPLNYAIVACVLGAVAVAAAVAPSLRAVSVNPTDALRSE